MTESLLSPPESICGWVRLFHPAGVLVTLPVPVGTPISPAQAKDMLLSVSGLLAAGWQVSQQSLDEGETLERVTHLVRRVKFNEDASETPLLDVYTGGNFRQVSVYLNTPEDRSVFEEISGMELNGLPLFEGDAPIERQRNPNRDRSYVVAVNRLAVVWKMNPRYEGAEDKKHPKRLFVRWHPAEPVTAPATEDTAGAAAPPKPQRVYRDGSAVNGNEAEQAAYDAYLLKVGNPPPNIDALRAWVSTHRSKA